jgi:hypothetical protein
MSKPNLLGYSEICLNPTSLGSTKDYQIGMCCFTANHAALRRKSKDWLARNQGNVSEWSDMSCVELGASPPIQQFFSYITVRTS